MQLTGGVHTWCVQSPRLSLQNLGGQGQGKQKLVGINSRSQKETKTQMAKVSLTERCSKYRAMTPQKRCMCKNADFSFVPKQPCVCQMYTAGGGVSVRHSNLLQAVSTTAACCCGQELEWNFSICCSIIAEFRGGLPAGEKKKANQVKLFSINCLRPLVVCLLCFTIGSRGGG